MYRANRSATQLVAPFNLTSNMVLEVEGVHLGTNNFSLVPRRSGGASADAPNVAISGRSGTCLNMLLLHIAVRQVEAKWHLGPERGCLNMSPAWLMASLPGWDNWGASPLRFGCVLCFFSPHGGERQEVEVRVPRWTDGSAPAGSPGDVYAPWWWVLCCWQSAVRCPCRKVPTESRAEAAGSRQRL